MKIILCCKTKKPRLNQISVIRLSFFSFTKNKPSAENHAVSTCVYDARGYHALFLSLRRRKIRRKPKMFLVVIDMQACIDSLADSLKMENGLKCLIRGLFMPLLYWYLPVKCAILWILCSSNGCRNHLSKCLVYILLWLYMPFSRLKRKTLLIVDLSPNVVNHSFYF